ncbi:hypothetical protein CP157_01101 [Paracoccus marcusii]|uniref:hypothetical protein n=1 Tax=Paracoccus marcusii TaxID=59779 RepID=UPI001C3E2ADA|nr:hypothetical protein [Paracoccus marcusii]QXI63383.1 hypothetical protein CP157_01101 [Paracoccus marcusii]
MTAHTPRHSPCVEFPNPEAAACLGLQGFSSRMQAHEARVKIPRRRGKVLVVYFCETCRKYHLGRP